MGDCFYIFGFGIIGAERKVAKMTIGEILNQIYNTGILALAIMALVIAIIVYPTLKKKYSNKK